MDSRSKKILGVIVALCVVGAVAYIAVAALGPSETTTEARPRAGALLASTDLMVRAVDPDEPTLNGRVYVLDDGHLRKEPGDLACERVYFAAGHGICMGVASSGVEYTASTFNAKLQRQHTTTLTGLPSRTRVSGDGRHGSAASCRGGSTSCSRGQAGHGGGTNSSPGWERGPGTARAREAGITRPSARKL